MAAARAKDHPNGRGGDARGRGTTLNGNPGKSHETSGRQPPAGSLFLFFFLTFALTWICWSLARALAASAGPDAPLLSGLRWFVLTFGVIAPSLVAMGLTWRAEGRPGLAALLRQLFRWRVPIRFYVLAVGYMAAIKLVTALVHRLSTGAWPRFGDDPWYLILAGTFFSVAAGGQAGEEIGWRGYALPRLWARVGLARGSLILGAIWATWHLPLFFFPGADKNGQSFPLYLVQVTALSAAIAWLYWRTGGSLLLTMLMHSAVNQSIGIVSSAVPGATNPFALSTSLVGWLTAALLWIGAAYFLFQMRRAATQRA